MFFRVPKSTKSILNFGKSIESSGQLLNEKELTSSGLSKEFTLLVWNVYKGQKTKFLDELRHFSKSVDFLILQEVLHESGQDHLHCPSLNHFFWSMGVSFEYSLTEKRTGIANGSLFPSRQTKLIRSSKREAFYLTPKSALLTEYQVQNESLLVVNCHSLNFTNHGAYVHQLENLVQEIKTHPGPLIVAGDFNTWNSMRRSTLELMFSSLGLDWLTPNNDSRILKLDHIFARGISVIDFSILDDANGSDHKPLSLKFKLEINPDQA